MRQLGFAATALAIFLILLATPASADNGPHGNFTPTTDACAGCHLAHTAQAPGLLTRTSQVDLCLSCHGRTASGADTNVEDGIYELRASGGQYGTVGRALRGGGFSNALMDTDWDDVADPSVTTSLHNIDDEPGTMWGNGAPNSGAGTVDITLQCGSCHNPHGGAGSSGNPTYRLLRAVPAGSGAGTSVDVTDPVTKTYTVSDTISSHGTILKSGHQYFGEIYDPDDPTKNAQLSSWCAQCHGRYHGGPGSGHTPFTDPDLVEDDIFTYRHTSDGQERGCLDCHSIHTPPLSPDLTSGPFFHKVAPGCLTCHVAHGTSASMSGSYSGSVKWPDNTDGDGPNNSRLLRMDNRGVCLQCHAVGE